MQESMVAKIEVSHEKTRADYRSVLVLLKFRSQLVLAWNGERHGWEFPGGHREENESVKQTAQREALEETGLAIKGIRPRGHYVLPDGHVTIYVTATCESFSPVDLSHETTEVALFDHLPDNLTFRLSPEKM